MFPSAHLVLMDIVVVSDVLLLCTRVLVWVEEIPTSGVAVLTCAHNSA